jgi:large subunit ribosomal protein L2
MVGVEVKASGGHQKSPTVLQAKGYKTRKKKNQSDKYIVRRRKKK